MIRTAVILFFFFFLSESKVYSQNKNKKVTRYHATIDNYNLDKYCYQGGQQEINFCLNEVDKKLSDILQVKYGCLVSYYESEINKYSTSINDTLILTDLKKQKQFLISSQTAWRKLTKANALFWSTGGGTITPMHVAQSSIKDIKDRLLWLDSIIEEEGQGNVRQVLSCK